MWGTEAARRERESEKEIEKSERWHVAEKRVVIAHQYDLGSNSEGLNS
jgi:hypothetical protein